MAKTILIVEDNELNLKLCNDLLQAHGYDTLQSRNGADVMTLAREHRPDLIVMDIRLPHVSGLDLTKHLKADRDLGHIPVVAVTACTMAGDERKCLEAGCDAYVMKPYSVPDLVETIARVLKMATPVAHLRAFDGGRHGAEERRSRPDRRTDSERRTATNRRGMAEDRRRPSASGPWTGTDRRMGRERRGGLAGRDNGDRRTLPDRRLLAGRRRRRPTVH